MSEPVPDQVEPVIDDADTAGFWDGARRGALAVQFCSGCGEPVHLPRPRCPSCGCVELVWRDVEAVGSVYSWTVVRHQVHPAFPVPYTVVLVALRDYPQVRFVGRMAGAVSPRPGQSLRVRFDARSPRTSVPQWELADLE